MFLGFILVGNTVRSTIYTLATSLLMIGSLTASAEERRLPRDILYDFNQVLDMYSDGIVQYVQFSDGSFLSYRVYVYFSASVGTLDNDPSAYCYINATNIFVNGRSGHRSQQIITFDVRDLKRDFKGGLAWIPYELKNYTRLLEEEQSDGTWDRNLISVLFDVDDLHANTYDFEFTAFEGELLYPKEDFMLVLLAEFLEKMHYACLALEDTR